MKSFDRRLKLLEAMLAPPPPPAIVLLPGREAPVGFTGPVIRVRVVDGRRPQETIQ